MDIISKLSEFIENSNYIKKVEFNNSTFILYSDNTVYNFNKVDKYFRLELTDVIDIKPSNNGINYIKNAMAYHLNLDKTGPSGPLGFLPDYW
jgi:hypothetical protein